MRTTALLKYPFILLLSLSYPCRSTMTLQSGPSSPIITHSFIQGAIHFLVGENKTTPSYTSSNCHPPRRCHQIAGSVSRATGVIVGFVPITSVTVTIFPAKGVDAAAFIAVRDDWWVGRRGDRWVSRNGAAVKTRLGRIVALPAYFSLIVCKEVSKTHSPTPPPANPTDHSSGAMLESPTNAHCCSRNRSKCPLLAKFLRVCRSPPLILPRRAPRPSPPLLHPRRAPRTSPPLLHPRQAPCEAQKHK